MLKIKNMHPSFNNVIRLIFAFLALLPYSLKAQQRPNIIVIMADDMGYSDIGSFGSEIHTPNLDTLAMQGLRMTQFYNASRCCPSRAALLTGLYPHQAGIGAMDRDTGHPAYRGFLSNNSVTIAEALGAAGYRTLMAGKWHVGAKPENWPRKRGFDRYFGLIHGAGSYFNPVPYRPNQQITIALDDKVYQPGKDFYATDAFTDYALQFIDENNGQKPFFLYLAYTSPHWPLHAPESDIAKYKGKYLAGWDKLRQERYQRMLSQGIMTKSTKLSPRDSHVPAWDSLSKKEKSDWDHKMAAYAAMIDRMDQNIGRIRQHLKKIKADKNTVIIFLSDNGASHEAISGSGFSKETLENSLKAPGSPASFTAYEYSGANLSNTPFRSFKHWGYEGGSATPFIAYYPPLIGANTFNHQPAHIIDLMPTCLDLAGASYPKRRNNINITPMQGTSLLPVLKSEKWKGHQTLFFEHMGHRSVRKGDWKLVAEYPGGQWELYNMKNDRSELQNVKNKYPKKVQELQIEYERWAEKVKVVPPGNGATAAPGNAKSRELIIKGKIPVYIHPQESPEVRRAVTDLLRDLQTVFGQHSAVVTTLPKTGPVIVVATGSRLKDKHPELKDWEAHQVYVNQEQIVLNGADNRGTIYAIYTLSELLGVKPLWFWASEQPKRIEELRLAGNFKKIFKSPDIKYRTWFPNDTDLLSPWQARSQENYEAIFESMLRLKLNTIEGGIADEKSFDADLKLGRQAAAAQSRGLVNTGHHMLIFGSSYNHWGQYWTGVRKMPAPELTIANRKALSEFWGYHIDLAKKNNLEVIWLVGFRGNRDIPFWEFFPDAPADASSRAQVIAGMARIQIDLLKKKTGDPHPPMRMTLYNEMTTLVAEGLLKIPNEPSLIRNFVAARRDHFPAQDIYKHSFSSNEPTGYYLNFQFTSSGSHLAQAEGPRKMEQNYRIVDSLSKGQLMFSVVNAGNVREHLLELTANAEMMWDFKNFNPDSFFNKFSTTYYGAERGPEIAALYKDFFNSYWTQKRADIPGFERQYIFQDMRYGRAAEMIIGDIEKQVYHLNPLDNHPLDNPDKGSVGYFRVIPEDNGVSNQIEALMKGTGASIEKLERITGKADILFNDPLLKGKVFFDDNLRGQAYVMLHLNRMLNNLLQGYQTRDNQATKKSYLKRSLEELQAVRQRLRQSEHGRFEGWYAKETKFGLKKIEERMKSLLARPVL